MLTFLSTSQIHQDNSYSSAFSLEMASTKLLHDWLITQMSAEVPFSRGSFPNWRSCSPLSYQTIPRWLFSSLHLLSLHLSGKWLMPIFGGNKGLFYFFTIPAAPRARSTKSQWSKVVYPQSLSELEWPSLSQLPMFSKSAQPSLSYLVVTIFNPLSTLRATVLD